MQDTNSSTPSCLNGEEPSDTTMTNECPSIPTSLSTTTVVVVPFWLWEALTDLGLSTVEITGSGSGDSGQFDDILLTPSCDLPKSIETELVALVEQAWSEEYGSYGDGDGGEVTATFHVQKRRFVIQQGYYNTETIWLGSVCVREHPHVETLLSPEE